MPAISIIVPVYNVEAYLARCVDSIMDQSFRDFELILVDDGSPDNCGTICEEYARKDSRIHVIHQENGGLSAARNAGIDWAFENSNSQWLTFVDSDDWIHTNYLKILFRSAMQNQVDIAACNLRLTESILTDPPIEYAAASVVTPSAAYIQHYEKCMTACGKLIAKKLYEALRFPVGKIHEDAYITHILTFRAESVAIVPEGLYYYFWNFDGITKATWTPRRMDGLEAHEQRLAFFLEREEQGCYRKELAKTVEFLTENLRILMELYDSGDLYREYFHLLRDKIRQYYRCARQQNALPRNRETMWSWMFAVRPECIWKSAHALRKLYCKLK